MWNEIRYYRRVHNCNHYKSYKKCTVNRHHCWQMTDWIHFKYCYWCCGIRFKIKSEWKTIKLMRKICKGRTVPYWPYFKWWRTWLIFSIFFCHVKFGFSSPNFLVISFTFTFSSFSHSLSRKPKISNAISISKEELAWSRREEHINSVTVIVHFRKNWK